MCSKRDLIVHDLRFFCVYTPVMKRCVCNMTRWKTSYMTSDVESLSPSNCESHEPPESSEKMAKT